MLFAGLETEPVPDRLVELLEALPAKEKEPEQPANAAQRCLACTDPDPTRVRILALR
jgi:hypothetical protein